MTNRDGQFYCNDCQTYQPKHEKQTDESALKEHSRGTCDEARWGKILPAGLHNWFMANRLDGTTLIYNRSMERQVMWVRDSLAQAFVTVPTNPYHDIKERYKKAEEEARAKNLPYEERPKHRDPGNPGDFMLNCVKVVSTHKSKSCKLPVYGIDFIPGIVLTFRGNFHNWQISVKAERDLDLDLVGVGGSEEREISHCYCEGFPRERWSGNTYPDNKRDFTVTIWGPDERLHTLFWQIAKNFR